MTTTSTINLIWASKPGCSLAVAEFWIGRERLWFTLYLDDNDGVLKIELLPSLGETSTCLVDFAETQRLIGDAKRDLLAMAAQP